MNPKIQKKNWYEEVKNAFCLLTTGYLPFKPGPIFFTHILESVYGADIGVVGK
jgi:hypothetical protein